MKGIPNSLEKKIKHAKQIAIDLLYPKDILFELDNAKSDAEIEVIMCGARKRMQDEETKTLCRHR